MLEHQRLGQQAAKPALRDLSYQGMRMTELSKAAL